MSALSEQILPSAWSVFRDALLAGPIASRQQLVDSVTPSGLIRRSAKSTSRHARPSLQALIDVGAVIDDESGVRLAHSFGSEEEFRLFVGRRYLDVGTDVDTAWEHREGTRQLVHEAELATAWLHLQGVDTPVVAFSGADKLLTAQLGTERDLLRDTAPFNSFEKIARWCGVATSATSNTGQSLVPDPFRIVRSALAEILPTTQDEQARAVVVRIGELFSWLPHGAVGRAVAAELRNPPDSSAERGACPQALSIALIQLEIEGLIELVTGDDAADRMSFTLTGGGSLPVARIRRR